MQLNILTVQPTINRLIGGLIIIIIIIIIIIK